LPARTRRLVLTFGALATTLMLALLTLNLVDIERQRRIAARQEARVETLVGQARPDFSRARRGLEQGLPPVKAGLRRADRLVRGLLGHGGPAAIEAAGELARDLTAGHRASALVDRGNELLVELQRSGAVDDVDVLPRLTAELLSVSRELAAIGRDTGADADVLRAQTIDFKRKSLAIQRQTLAILRESLAVQQETLVHARSLDRRTGGAITPPSR
jgi:hypothetical protein